MELAAAGDAPGGLPEELAAAGDALRRFDMRWIYIRVSCSVCVFFFRKGFWRTRIHIRKAFRTHTYAYVRMHTRL